jgi:DNA-binding protein YbaB
MFDKLKQIKQLNDLRSSLGQEKEEAENRGVRIVLNGKMEMESIVLNPELSKEEQEAAIKNCFSEAMKKIQMIMAQKMSQFTGM